MDVEFTAGGKVRTQRAFEERESADEPGYPCEVSELSAGDRHHNPFAICGIKIAGKAAAQTIGDTAVLMNPDWLGRGEEAERASRDSSKSGAVFSLVKGL
jgi:hypothetical protein